MTWKIIFRTLKVKKSHSGILEKKKRKPNTYFIHLKGHFLKLKVFSKKSKKGKKKRLINVSNHLFLINPCDRICGCTETYSEHIFLQIWYYNELKERVRERGVYTYVKTFTINYVTVRP